MSLKKRVVGTQGLLSPLQREKVQINHPGTDGQGLSDWVLEMPSLQSVASGVDQVLSLTVILLIQLSEVLLLP